ncbi:hypothetical protein EA58_15515 [Photobacterium galatheae]|uniref:Uncharacterized protein n=1 Tax=Photobacterium galatheae TaxID=1654360 RepID=A0A066RSY0_9GAMM|nr:hypothetical protein EA58_15515 [Photobacterium galatheae]
MVFIVRFFENNHGENILTPIMKRNRSLIITSQYAESCREQVMLKNPIHSHRLKYIPCNQGLLQKGIERE